MFKDILSSSSTSEALYNLGILIIILVLSAFILRWLWNKVLVPHVTVIKPLESLLDAFLMSLAISVIRGS